MQLRNDDSALIGTVATDEIGSVHYPRSKVGFGVDGAYVDVSATDPLPITVPGTVAVTQSASWTVGVSGTVPVSNAGTFAVQVSAALPAGSNTIGAVNLAEYTPSSGRLPVTGAGGTFPVTGALTDAELRATAVPVSGTVTANLGATDNAVLDDVAAKLGTIDADTGNIATSAASLDAKTPSLGQALAAASTPVVLTAAQITTLTPPAAITGFATSAKQDTIIGHVDGLEGLLGTIDADTGSAATSLAAIAEWDESDRGKVNPVVGQAGVAAGSGSVDAKTQRVILASDDPASAAAVAINTKTPALGQALAAASVPVVLTAAQVSTLTPPAAITGFATAAKQDTIIDAVDGIEPLLTTIDADTGAIAASLAAMDDWDSNDRAKVSPIAGQDGVAGGSGAVSATTQRMTLATDVGLPAGTNVIGHVILDTGSTTAVTDGGGSITIDASSLPLPTGASTAAKQPALGTAGSASADVISVQGVASMTALTVDGSAVTQPVSAASLPLPSGAATAANQSTGNTSLATIAGAVSGTEVQVDVLTMPTTTVQATNLDIRDLTATDVVTANLSATDNAVLDAIEADTTTLASAVATISATPLQRVAIFDAADAQITTFGGGVQYTEGDTDSSITGTAALMEVGSNTLQPIQGTVADGLLVNLGANNDVTVSGVSTSAKQDTIIGHVDGIETVLGTIDADTGNIATSTATVASSVATVSATPLVRVGIFDAADAQITTFGGGTQYTEDAAAAANPVGTALILVREDARAGSLTSADGDNVAARGNDKGELYVKHTDSIAVTDNSGSLTVDNGGTFAVQVDGAALTSLQLIDDTVVVLGTDTYTEATSKGVVIGGVRRDADTTLANTTNEFAPFQVDARGCVKVEAFSGETLPVSLASVPSHAVTNAGTFAVQAVCTNAGTFAVQAVATNAGTFAVQVDGAALTSLQLIDDAVATLGTDTYTETTTKGITIGAVRRDADTTLVGTTNEIGPLQMDANGRLKVEAFSGETLPVSYATTGSGNATGALRVELANNGTGVVATVGTVSTVTAVTSITNTVTTNEAASGTATLSNVSGSVSSVTLIASNANRKGVILYNDSTAACYVKYGSSASSTSYTVRMFDNDYHEVPAKYTGIVTGVWEAASGTMRVTELT